MNLKCPKAIRSQLLDFQAAAVKITARRIMVQGGAMIADVVGLGQDPNGYRRGTGT